MSVQFARSIRTVDSHTEGNPTRVIIGGTPTPPGRTLLDKRQWLMNNDDGLRRLLNFEPRGSGLMCSVLLLPAENKESDFAVVIMEQDEYVPMCGHCIIGAATTVVATGMVHKTEPVTTVRFDTPAGLVVCDVVVKGGQIGAVSFNNVESFVLLEREPLSLATLGEIAVDVAYGGDMYVFVDADVLEIDLSPHNDAQMIDASIEIRKAVAEQLETVHPERPDINTCYQVLFTSERRMAGDYKQTIICPPGSLDRSPCGTGTSARVALLNKRGELDLHEKRKFEGVLGTCMGGEAVAAAERGGITYVTPRITGRAYITGFHHFVLDADDPLPNGYRIGPVPKDYD